MENLKSKSKNSVNIKDLFKCKNVDIDKIVVPNKVSFSKKWFTYFVSYEDAKKIKPLCIFLSNMSAYRKNFDETKYISFSIKDNELLEKYNEVWEKVKNSLKKELDSV